MSILSIECRINTHPLKVTDIQRVLISTSRTIHYATRTRVTVSTCIAVYSRGARTACVACSRYSSRFCLSVGRRSAAVLLLVVFVIFSLSLFSNDRSGRQIFWHLYIGVLIVILERLDVARQYMRPRCTEMGKKKNSPLDLW